MRSHPFRTIVLPCMFALVTGGISTPSLAGQPARSAAVADCGAMAAWVASQTYRPGDQVSYQGRIYESTITGANIPPDYCLPCGWWKYVADCGTTTTCTMVPTTPTGLVSPRQTTTSVDLAWNAVATSPGCTVTYQVFQDGKVVAAPNGTAVTVGNLKPSTAYAFHVIAVNQAGPSNQSVTVTAKTLGDAPCTQPPSVPEGLKVTQVTSTQVALAWTPVSVPTGCSVTYTVHQDGKAVSTVPTPSAAITGLKPETTYAFSVSATNQAGTSSPSAEVSVKTLPVTQSQLPRHILTGYWQNFNNGAKVLRVSDVPKDYDLICIAFAESTATPGAITFNLDPGLGFSEAQFIQDIATVKARGQHVILSVGGERGTVAINSTASAAQFTSTLNALMDKYGFEGVDIDLEHGINATYLAQALRAIKPGSIITMAPQTLDMQSPGTEYFKLALAIKDILTVVNIQYYNSGAMLGYDGKVYSQGGVDFLTALAAIQLENGLRPDQVGLGLPASPSGAGSGYVDPSIVNRALDCLSTGTQCGSFKAPGTYPALRGAMTWSINWDASNGYAFARAVRAKLDAMP